MALVETVLALFTLESRSAAEAAMQRIDDTFERLDTFGTR